jgi:AIPR protein
MGSVVTNNTSKDLGLFPLNTLFIRKISTKEDENSDFMIHVGQAPIKSFLDLPDNQNVRDYIPESSISSRLSGVHKAIKDTLVNHPALFGVLNGGIVIVAESILLDGNKTTVWLQNPSIINGSQTRGVIKDFLATNHDEPVPNVKFEIITTTNKDLAADISIARNFQTPVKHISILGKKDYFQDIEANFKDWSEKNRILKTSETDRGENYIPTEKLLQVIATLIPEQLWCRTGKGEISNKAFAYSSASGTLKLFEKIYKEAKEDKDIESISLYQFYIDIASDAWRLYEKWTRHQGFIGTRLQKGITRDEQGNILNVSDGIIFPILAAHSAFIWKRDGHWIISMPLMWKDIEIINMAKGHFLHTGSNPGAMGKDKSAYSALYVFAAYASRYEATSSQRDRKS